MRVGYPKPGCFRASLLYSWLHINASTCFSDHRSWCRPLWWLHGLVAGQLNSAQIQLPTVSKVDADTAPTSAPNDDQVHGVAFVDTDDANTFCGEEKPRRFVSCRLKLAWASKEVLQLPDVLFAWILGRSCGSGLPLGLQGCLFGLFTCSLVAVQQIFHGVGLGLWRMIFQWLAFPKLVRKLPNIQWCQRTRGAGRPS